MEDDSQDLMKVLKDMVKRDHDKQILDTCTETTLTILDMCLQYKKKPGYVLKLFNEIYSKLGPVNRG